ncbi:MAG: hypothetical protein KDA90_20675, partial [Planctomycetaceae bacterium]|nr:hypothetical protein [Planctomycetaceae bacterium]
MGTRPTAPATAGVQALKNKPVDSALRLFTLTVVTPAADREPAIVFSHGPHSGTDLAVTLAAYSGD